MIFDYAIFFFFHFFISSPSFISFDFSADSLLFIYYCFLSFSFDMPLGQFHFRLMLPPPADIYALLLIFSLRFIAGASLIFISSTFSSSSSSDCLPSFSSFCFLFRRLRRFRCPSLSLRFLSPYMLLRDASVMPCFIDMLTRQTLISRFFTV